MRAPRRRGGRRRRATARLRIAATAPSAIAKDAVARAGADRVHAGEGAERGQHADVVAEPEARQAQVVEAAPAEAHARMQVAGEHVGAAARPRVVAEREAVELERLVDDAHAEVGGGSPARSSWLPRTRTSSSDACSRRQRATAPSVAGACERAEWRKSPRKTTRRARQVAISADSAASVSLVVPRGTGTPRARKLTALPMCASAISSVRLAARNAAFSAQQGQRPAGRPGSSSSRRAPSSPRQAANRRSATSRCSVGLLLEARAREALQAADRERGQRRRLRLRVDGRRLPSRAPSASWRRLWRSCDSIRSKNWFMRAVRRSFSNTSASPTITRVMPGFFSPNWSSTARTLLHLHARVGLALDDLVDEREDALLDELDQALEHLRLAREVAIERRLGDVELGGERRRRDALGAGLLQHRRQRLEDLDAPLAGARALARRRRRRARAAPGRSPRREAGGGVGRRVLGVAGSPGGRV